MSLELGRSGRRPTSDRRRQSCVFVCVVVKATAELNAKLEDERRMLLGQLQTLMDQLHRLLSELITSKDSYANEQKTYLSVASRQLYSLRERATNTSSTLSDQQTAESNAHHSLKQSWDPAVGKSFSYAYRHLLWPRPRGFWNSAVCLSHGAAAWAIGTLAACSLATAGQCRDVRTADPSVDGRSRSLRDFNVRLRTDGLIGGETICRRRRHISSRRPRGDTLF